MGLQEIYCNILNAYWGFGLIKDLRRASYGGEAMDEVNFAYHLKLIPFLFLVV
ncbi:hypothetical protein [Neisseria sp. 83E34]|uniref:hypothetical protein n=1 Tax=Neisseria sp. 83E34 TaxID=1692264 RepID=UPI000AD2D40C|nr:hypothetical protein [Neisseria sp. 83E34]